MKITCNKCNKEVDYGEWAFALSKLFSPKDTFWCIECGKEEKGSPQDEWLRGYRK